MTFICLKTVLFPDSPAPRSRSLIFSASLFAWQARLCSISLASFFLSCSSGPSLLAVQPILLSKHLGPFLTYLIRSGLLALMNFVATECGHSWALELSLSQRCIGGYFRLGRYAVTRFWKMRPVHSQYYFVRSLFQRLLLQPFFVFCIKIQFFHRYFACFWIRVVRKMSENSLQKHSFHDSQVKWKILSYFVCRFGIIHNVRADGQKGTV